MRNGQAQRAPEQRGNRKPVRETANQGGLRCRRNQPDGEYAGQELHGDKNHHRAQQQTGRQPPLPRQRAPLFLRGDRGRIGDCANQNNFRKR